MTIRRSRFLIAAAALSLCPFAFAQDPSPVPNGATEPQGSPARPKFSKFIMDALSSPHALKGKLYVSRDGTVERSKVYLKREGLPEWTHEVADAKLGKGEDLSYEVEVYGDGTEVFEISRRIDGKPKKVSIRRDRQVRYVETTVDRTSLPAVVSATLAKIDGFQPTECHRRDGEKTAEFHIRGIIAGVPHRARIGADGTLQSLDRHLAAEMEVSVIVSEPAAK